MDSWIDEKPREREESQRHQRPSSQRWRTRKPARKGRAVRTYNIGAVQQS